MSVMAVLEATMDAFEPLSDSEEALVANITRASSPDTSGSHSDGRGAALVKRPWTPEEDEQMSCIVATLLFCTLAFATRHEPLHIPGSRAHEDRNQSGR